MNAPPLVLVPPALLPASSVLDVGCGIRPHRFFPGSRFVGVDVHRPYVDALAGEPGEFICSDWRVALRRYRRNEFDLVTALDFIEHLPRRDGRDFLRAAQRVGKQVCIFTPLGPYPQHFEPGEPDGWGMDGAYWQTHRSAWWPEDFPGWNIQVCEEFHPADAWGVPFPEPISAFWAVKETS